jgi:hypothetical protein
MQQLTGKKKFVIKKTKPSIGNVSPASTENSPNPFIETANENNTFLKLDAVPYSEKIKLTRSAILDQYVRDESGNFSIAKVQLLFDHLKYKKPEAAANILLDLIKIEQKEQDLLARNRNFGAEAKPPAPILIQINNNLPGTEIQTPEPLTQEQKLEYLIEEHSVKNIESDLPAEEIVQLLPKKDQGLLVIKKEVEKLDENEKQSFFADIENQKRFLASIAK